MRWLFLMDRITGLAQSYCPSVCLSVIYELRTW